MLILLNYREHLALLGHCHHHESQTWCRLGLEHISRVSLMPWNWKKTPQTVVNTTFFLTTKSNFTGYSILCVSLSHLSFYIYKEFLENELYNKHVWSFNVSFFLSVGYGLLDFIGFSNRDFRNYSEITKQHKDQLWKIGYTPHHGLYELISNGSLGKKTSTEAYTPLHILALTTY